MLSTDAQNFAIDLQTGNLDLTGGRLNLSRGIEGVAQAALVRVKRIRGEWFRDRGLGVPYIAMADAVTESEALLGQKFDGVKFDVALRTALESTPGVSSVLLASVTRDPRTRKVASRWQLRTAFGDTPVQQLEH